MFEDVLITEHKIFFSENYRSVYDKKNKNIMAKYDKHRQGLVRNVKIETDYQTSVIYEAFITVYEEQITIISQRENKVGTIFLKEGKMSKNIKLEVQLHGQT